MRKCCNRFTQFELSKIKTLEIKCQGTSEGVKGLERLGEVGSEISDLKTSRVPVVDPFHRVSIEMLYEMEHNFTSLMNE